MINIDQTLQAADLTEALDRMWQLSGEKVLSIDRSWTDQTGAPVFTVEGKYQAQGN